VLKKTSHTFRSSVNPNYVIWNYTWIIDKIKEKF
jgi:hypothetical protein